MGLDAGDKKVYDLLNDKMYTVAANQRKYVWTRNNWQELLDDLELVYNEHTNSHFIGSVVLKKESATQGIRNQYSIIDGQQRISTLTIVLCAIGLIFAENEQQEYFDGLNKPLFVMDNRNRPHPIVSDKANKSISSLVVKLFENANAHFSEGEVLFTSDQLLKQAKVNKDISECFMFFYSWFRNRVLADMEMLFRYRNIIDDIRYIDIVATEDEDAYTIFEILNARGQVLTDFELLRNFILRYAPVPDKGTVKEKLKTLAESLGSDSENFLKHYVLHKYGKKTDKNENRPYKIISKAEKSHSKIDLLDDLLLKASYYRRMTSYDECSELEKKVFSFFKPRRQVQFRPLVLGMMHQKELGNLSQQDYELYLEFLYEFFICYHIVGEQTSNKIEDVVYGYSYRLENDFGEQTLERFRRSMVERMPSKENFCNSIKRIRYSNHWKAYSGSNKRENVRAIFEIIERELGYTGAFDGFDIEHCMPDAASEDHAHIGNLMLLEQQINSEQCKGKPLPEKIQYYQNSELELPVKMYNENPSGNVINLDDRSTWIANTLYSYIKKIQTVKVAVTV